MSTQIKDFIETKISVRGCIKATELFFQLGDFASSTHKELWELIEELKKEGKIIELEYVLPDENNRVKSIFFPAKTSFKIIGRVEHEIK